MTVPTSRPAGFRIRVPATSANLGPGFDCFGLAFRRYLHLTIIPQVKRSAWRIELSGEGAAIIPADKRNLIYRSLLLGAGVAEDDAPGAAARMVNEIPLARGQGSSAAAIVAGMTAGQLLVSGECDREAVIREATRIEGHPDNVAAAVMGGLVLTRHADGDVRARAVPTSVGAVFVSAVPEFELTTRASRAVLPEHVCLADGVFNLRAAAWMAAAWAAGDWEGVAEAMEDRLHQPYRAPLIPGFADVCFAAREAGALAACLSGSGPTILALTLAHAEEVAQAMEEAWRRHTIRSRAQTVLIDTDGLVVFPNTSKD